MRKLISALMRDEEVRRNAGLVSALSGLQEEVRQRHCLAHVLTLLTAKQLAPDASTEPGLAAGPLSGAWVFTTPLFGEKFFVCLSGPWKDHLLVDGGKSSGARFLKLRGRSEPLPLFQVSSELAGHVRVIEEFWGVRGYLVP